MKEKQRRKELAKNRNMQDGMEIFIAVFGVLLALGMTLALLGFLFWKLVQLILWLF